jgi:hypothetical protein
LRSITFTSLFIFAITLFHSLPLLAQRYTISGYVKDAGTGEDLIGASIVVKATGQGTVTNPYGYYSLTVPADSLTLVFSYLGYNNLEKTLRLAQNTTLSVNLTLQSRELSEVVVQANSLQEKADRTQMSVEQLTTREAK